MCFSAHLDAYSFFGAIRAFHLHPFRNPPLTALGLKAAVENQRSAESGFTQ